MRDRDTTATLRKRLSAALMAAFFLALHAEAIGAHACPHHLMLPGDAAVGHGHEGAASHADDGRFHPCTCVGVCQGGSTVSIAPTPSAPSLEAPPDATDVHLKDASLSDASADYLIPYPHGPPATA